MASHAYLAKMLAKTHLHLLSAPAGAPIVVPPVPSPIPPPSRRRRPPNLSFSARAPLRPSPPMASSSASAAAAAAPSSGDRALALEPGPEEDELGRLAEVAGRAADAAGEVIRRYFRKKFEILDKEDLSPVTIADQAAEEAMVAIILGSFPTHAIYGEEKGWRCKERSADYVWVLDPIDGTKSFITGKPLFGTLIALLHKGKPILGIIDQPVLKERWVGITGKRTTLNGEEMSTRACTKISQAYLYTTSPHLFKKDAEEAFARVRSKVKVPLYGCDCYAYALLASGFVDLVIESGLKPYDFLALIPVIEGAGGIITDWKGHQLYWEPSPDSHAQAFNVVAAGDKEVHQQALDLLQWQLVKGDLEKLHYADTWDLRAIAIMLKDSRCSEK